MNQRNDARRVIAPPVVAGRAGASRSAGRPSGRAFVVLRQRRGASFSAGNSQVPRLQTSRIVQMAAFSRNGSGEMGSPSVRWSLSGRRPDGVRSPAARDADPAFPGSTYTTLASACGVAVHEVACDWEAGARMKERFSQFGLSLVRRGMFVRTTPRVEFLIDPTTAYFEQPGFEQQISHPRGAGGITTVVLLSDDAMVRYAGDVTLPDVLIPDRSRCPAPARGPRRRPPRGDPPARARRAADRSGSVSSSSALRPVSPHGSLSWDPSGTGRARQPCP